MAGPCPHCGFDSATSEPSEAATLASPEGAGDEPAAAAGAGLVSIAPGREIAGYRILERLGQGGMGQVFRAEHLRLGRQVAIKALPTELLQRDDLRQRFLREARSASALNHPNIVTIHDLVSDGDQDFIVMELVEGRSLDRILHRGPIPAATAIHLAQQIADALEAAHGEGILHRDLKPSNVMVNERGVAKLLDFGLAKRFGDDAAEEGVPVTRQGTVPGTAQYMSPEQARDTEIGFESDIFSLGVVLYEMVAGVRPFDGGDRLELMLDICQGEPVALSEVDPRLPPALGALVERLLRKEPQERLRPMSRVRQELQELLQATPVSTPSPLWTQPSLATGPSASKENGRRSRALVAALVVLGLAIAAIVFWRTRTGDVERGSSPAAAPTEMNLADLTPFGLSTRAFELLGRFDRQGYLEEARSLLQTALGEDSDFALAYAGLARSYYVENISNPDPSLLDLALENARTAARLNPDLAIARTQLATVLGAKGQSDEAEAEFLEAERLDPTDPAAPRELGLMLLREGRSAEAETALQRAVELDPDDWYGHLSLGVLFYNTARYAEAEGAFETSARLAGDSHLPYVNLAAVYQKQGDYDRAAASLQQALQRRPIASVYNNLGNIYYFQGLYQKAVTAFERAVELGPNESLRWGNLGDACRRVPDAADKARQAFTRALQLLRPQIEEQPGDVALLSRQALYLAKRGDAGEALNVADKVQELGSDSPSVLYRQTLTYELAGERRRALDLLTAALDAGYPLDEVKREPELAGLRQDADYHRLLVGLDEGQETP